nr:817_t:CDS:2 [Entrophospora candida]
MVNTSKIVQAIPLERLYVIHRDMKKYHDNWDAEKIISLASSSSTGEDYVIYQYLNRAAAAVGASLFLTNNENYKEAGGITAVVCLYADLVLSHTKERIFRTAEKNTKILYESYQELAEILKPISNSDLLNKSLNQLLKLRIEKEEIIKLMEILQEAISEYRQELSDDEIENKINDKMLKLEATQLFWKISLLSDDVNFIPKELKDDLIGFLGKINKSNVDESLDISNDKRERLLEENEIEQLIINLKNAQIN